jgi:hypothetical protein
MVLALFHENRFADLAPAQVYATLLDEGGYLCSERTMYRVLTANHEVRERRAQTRERRARDHRLCLDARHGDMQEDSFARNVVRRTTETRPAGTCR